MPHVEQLDRVITDVGNLRERVAVLEHSHTEIRLAVADNTRLTADTRSMLGETDRKVDTLITSTAEIVELSRTTKTIRSLIVGALAWMGGIGGAVSAFYGIWQVWGMFR